MQASTETAGALASAAKLAGAEFDALLDAAVDGILVIDVDGMILRFNRSAERMFGYQAEEVIGQPIHIIMTETDARRHDEYMERYMRTGIGRIIGKGREVVAQRRDGTLFPAALSVGRVDLPDTPRFVGLVRDLTVQKHAEEESIRHRDQLVHVSRLTTMGEMAAAMAHELNQPLSAISSYAGACERFLEQGEPGLAEVRAALGEIRSQAHRAGEVIRRIRSFTRSRELERRVTSIADLLEEIRPLAEVDAKAHAVRLRVELDEPLPKVTVDTVQIQQVILNLLRNGVDAMADLSPEERELTLTGRSEGSDWVCIEIKDRGPGISDEAAENLFTPFFTTKAGGMGMGLAISRSIVTAHGGRLAGMNRPAGGATFSITLPSNITDGERHA